MFNSIRFRKSIFSISFHQNKPLLTVGTSLGNVFLYNLNYEDKCTEKLFKNNVYDVAVRNVEFSPSGLECVATSSGGNISLFDIETKNYTWRTEVPNRAENAISSVCFMDQHSLVSGGDNGILQILDTRTKHGSSIIINKFCDVVNDIKPISENTFISSSLDQLAVFDIRKPKKVVVLLEDLTDEMMTIEIIKEGKHIVCGGLSGKAYLFSTTNWNAIPNRIGGNSEPINKMIKITESSLCASCEDGSVKIFNVYPNKIAGSLSFNNEKISSSEDICLSHDKKVLAFIMNYNNIYFANAKDAFDLAKGKKISTDDSDFFSDL